MGASIRTALSLLREALAGELDAKGNEELEAIEGMVRASLSELLSVLFLDVSEHVEPFLKDAKRAFFDVRERIDCDHRKSLLFYLGQIAAIAELAQVARTQAVPSEAARIMVNSEVARDIAKIIVSSGSLRPVDLASRLEKHSSNLVRVTDLMVKSGLIRRDHFGKSTMLSATPLTRTALAYVKYVGDTPSAMGFEPGRALPAL